MSGLSFATLTQAFRQPAALTLFFFGFTSGLPFLLVGGTLSAWLKESGIALQDIGLLSLVGLAYSFKFLWAPAVDRIKLPLLKHLGQRRSWLLAAQLTLACALLGMAALTPQSTSFELFVLCALAAAVAGATQDIVVDAYRIEIAPEEAQGALAATYTLGYRLALLASGALALTLADHLPWSMVYLLMAGGVGAVMLVTLFAREPARAPALDAPKTFAENLQDSVIGPFREFFTRFGGKAALLVLLFIGLFKISDQMIGVMAFPYYLDLGFSKTEIGTVSKLFGVWIGIFGAFLGGALLPLFGVQRTLLIAMVLAALSNLLFVVLGYFPGNLYAFIGVIGGENLVGGLLGTAAIAWLSSLVNREYTATQYALFSSLAALPGKLIGGFSGFMVEAINYQGFFVFSVLAVLPALVLYFVLQPILKKQQDASRDSHSPGQ